MRAIYLFKVQDHVMCYLWNPAIIRFMYKLKVYYGMWCMVSMSHAFTDANCLSHSSVGCNDFVLDIS
jgi:hypothetical protein